MKTSFQHVLEGFNIAFRALKANPVRSVLTTLGIVIGVLTVIMMITIIQGLNSSIENQLSFLGTGVLYVDRTPWIIMNDYYLYRNRPYITRDDYKAIRDASTLASEVCAEFITYKTVKYKETSTRVEIHGTSANYLKVVSNYPSMGRYLNEIDVEHNRHVVVIGSDVADQLFEKVNPIGRRISISGRKFRVIGVLEKQGQFLGQSMDNKVMIPHGTFIKNFGKRNYGFVLAKAKDPERLEDLEYELKGIMRRSRGLKPAEEDNFSINQQSMLMALYYQITSGVYTTGIVIGGISLLVGGIGIMNIMLVSVTERTREIGIRKAIGAKKINIVWQFLVESASICSIGGIIGVGIAYLLGGVIEQWLPTSMPPWVALLGVGFASVVGVFFGLWPAIKAANLHPIEALRYE